MMEISNIKDKAALHCEILAIKRKLDASITLAFS